MPAATPTATEERQGATIIVANDGLQPQNFHGDSNNYESWLEYFVNFAEYRKWDNEAKLRVFKLLMIGKAAEWLRSLTTDITNDFELLIAAFRDRYSCTDLHKWKTAADIWNAQQTPGVSVDEFITTMINKARQIPITDENLLKFAIIKGLRPNIRLHVLQVQTSNIEDVIKAAKVAEMAHAASTETTSNTEVARLTAELTALVNQIKIQQQQPTTVAAVQHDQRQTTTTTPTTSPAPRRVTFEDRRRSARDSSASRHQRQQQQRQHQRNTTTTQQRRFPGDGNGAYVSCRNCGGNHEINNCRAYGQQCFLCGRFNHFSRVCFAKQRLGSNQNMYYNGNQNY
jgi:hypothetical protein